MKVEKIINTVLKLSLCVSMVAGIHLSSSQVHAQEFVHVNFPDHLCAGTIDTLSFGYNSDNDISLVLRHATLSQAGRAFLPDGVSCGTMGCSYRSTVTFTDFAPTAHISSIQDIKYVRLNIEHSWIGDIYIGITCPNGQKASLMNWSGSGSTPCRSSIPQNHRSWSSGSNVSWGTYFGMPVDGEGSDDCDSSQYGNRPGTGWNYCWSNNTTSGFSYASSSASDDGIIYRSGHSTGGRIDSSNVAAGTNFYKPNESFSSLVGCPLNGNWYIEVIDGWGGDNGWIFGWEMALDPSLLPVDCELVERDIIGEGMVGLDDSTYVLTVPDSITSDSVMNFTLRMINNCGDTIDTVVTVNIHPNLAGERQDTVCDSYAWGSETIDHDTVLYTHLPTLWGCDSLLAINLTVLHSTADTISVAVVENDLPYSILDATFTEAVSDTLLHTTNAAGCDSAVLFTLEVWDNVTTMLDSAICAHMLPLTWNGVTFLSAGTQSTTFATSEGADSVVVMNLTVLTDDTVYVYDTVVENMLPYWCAGSSIFGPVDDTVTHLENRFGCDSAVHLSLYVWHNVYTDIDTALCARKLPVYWGNASFSDTHSVVLATVHGADSVVTMHVNVIPDDTINIFDTIVENGLPYAFDGQWTFVNDADTNLGLVSTTGCDSVLHYRLKVWRNVSERYTRQICTSQLPYMWNGETFDSAGTVIQHLYTAHGADSTVTLELILYPDYDTTVYPSICDNQSYSLGPRTLTAPGQYSHMFESIHGCDSLVNVELTVWPTYHTRLYDTVCASAGLTFDGVHYNQSGAYTKLMSTINQCDSMVTLNLTVKGLYLKARAHVSPSIVTPNNLDVGLEDISRAAIDRLWIIGDDEYTDSKLHYTYPSDMDTVPLSLIAYSDDGCADTLNRLLQIDRTAFFAPNTFTPSLETNSRWYIVSRDIEEMEVWIYNRQGNLVHYYSGADGYWDGTRNGKPCEQGVYVFRAEYHSRVYPDRLQSMTGTILLIR